MNISQEARSRAFQQLKPACIKLSEVALNRDAAESKDLHRALENLLQTIEATTLDRKLADYIFFPLSYVIKEAATVPTKSLSIAIRCLEILIRQGWQSSTDAALVRELLIFLTIQLSRSQQDDLQIALLQCLSALVECMGKVVSQVLSTGQQDNSAIAGQLVDTLLVATRESPAAQIQLLAVSLLKDLISILGDIQLLRMFLPGIVSQLSNILRPKVRRIYRVLVASMNTLDMLIQKTLANKLEKLGDKSEDASWRKATSSQLLLALSNMVPLRYHDRSEVLEAVGLLCLTILEDCSLTLENCRPLMLETLCVISSQDIPQIKSRFVTLTSNGLIGSSLQELVFKWLQSLPVKLQIQDDQVAERHITLICEGYSALQKAESVTNSLNQELIEAVQSGSRLLLIEGKELGHVQDIPGLAIQDLAIAKPEIEMKPLGSLDTSRLRQLGKLIHSANLFSVIEMETLDTYGSDLASLWTLTRSMSDRINTDKALQLFVSDTIVPEEIVDLALGRALDVLTSNSEDIDWRLQALALELISLVAQVEKEEFRTSLVDALFPMIELLGASNPILRHYAIASLSLVANHCGYSGPGDMMVQNVDYLVNSVALKFNTFDVSPQAVQVLVIMLELSGPSLIPYLDDLVDSIFGALAAYHGYPRLVEVMFSALSAVVRHGSSNTSSIMDVPRIEHTKQKSQKTQISDIPNILAQIRNPKTLEEEAESDEAAEHPDAAAQTTATSSTEIDKQEEPPKIYTMVQSVLRLSQHYLTHQEPYLRQKILELVSVGCSSLARNEEQFLPLINDIWPVVIQRLYDEEAIVALAAMQCLSAIFVGAGDFVSTRVQDEWSQIRSLFRTLETKALADRKGKAGKAIFSYTERLYDGIISMLLALVTHVRVKSDQEDDLFNMLGPLARAREDVKDALDILNSDALWLILEARKFVGMNKPEMEGFCFADIDVH